MRNFRSMTAIILALCLCLGLAACGRFTASLNIILSSDKIP